MSALAAVPTRRGTSNANVRGSSYTRRRRREWLVETYRADADALVIEYPSGFVITYDAAKHSAADANACGFPWRVVAACRCYRCGVILTAETVTVDRIVPGCQGGTYRRNNIRPACGRCNSETGGALARHPKKRGAR